MNINNNINNNNSGNNSVNQCMDEGESMFQATQYNDLLQLIKFQREKITTQQLELQKVSCNYKLKNIYDS